MSVFNPSAALSMVSACAALAERNTNKEALRGIAIQGTCERFAATDLETSLISSHFAWEEGWILAPAAKLLGALKAIGDREAEWIVEAETLTIKAPGSRFTLPLLPKGDFPILEVGTGVTNIQPLAGPLIEALEKVASHCASESARYTMTGIHMEAGKLIATDGKRLAVAEIPQTVVWDASLNATIPGKLTGIIKAVFQHDPEQMIKVAIGPNTVDFIGTHATISTRQIEGRYPDYKAILPRIIAHQIEADPGPLVDALRRIGFMVGQDLRMNVEFAPGSLTFMTQQTFGGDATAQVDFAWTEKPLTMSVNPKYLTDLLRGAGAGPVTIGVNTKDKPLVITAEGFQGLIMPMA